MADTENPEAVDQTADSGAKITNLRAWATGSRKRNAIILGALGLVAAATVGAWLMVAEMAAAPEEITVEKAFEALDAGEHDRARSIIAQLRGDDSLTAADYGGALYIMGALKINDAVKQWSSDRSRSDYYLASQYLTEGRSLGFPAEREAEGLFLLGKSLIESRQLTAGIDVLHQALEAGTRGEARAHLLLAQAHFYAPDPDYDQAVAEVDQAVNDPALTPEERSNALLLKSEALAQLGRGTEAQGAAQAAGGSTDPGRRALAEGKALVVQLKTASPSDKERLSNEAQTALDRARRADKLSTSVTRQSDYLKGKIAELLGETDEALRIYKEIRRSSGASPAGIAAAVAEGELWQFEDNDTNALEALRRALDAIEEPSSYRSSLLPLAEVRTRIEVAHQRFLDRRRYSAALQLAGWVPRLLGRTQSLKMRADALRNWGEELSAQGSSLGSRGKQMIREGRARFREAGVAYESLAEARYATRDFTDDLWTAAETYQKGQAYRDAIRVYERYIRNEPVKRNALALLRLAEAQLARGEDLAAITLLKECLEFHANEAFSYRARLVCAQAYRGIHNFDEAEKLLKENLTRTALTPASPEWRDSKFELGRLLAEAERHDEAIETLEEAIKRYSDDPQSREGRYLIAMAHRHAAQEPLERLRQANTLNEKEQARAEARVHLLAAYQMFESVRNEITLANSGDELDRATLRNCFMLGGDVLFELERYDEARQSFSNVSTLYQNEPYMLEAFVQIYHCWRRQRDRPKALGVIQQARQLIDRLPQELDFAKSTTLSRGEWDRLLTQLAQF